MALVFLGQVALARTLPCYHKMREVIVENFHRHEHKRDDAQFDGQPVKSRKRPGANEIKQRPGNENDRETLRVQHDAAIKLLDCPIAALHSRCIVRVAFPSAEGAFTAAG